MERKIYIGSNIVLRFLQFVSSVLLLPIEILNFTISNMRKYEYHIHIFHDDSKIYVFKYFLINFVFFSFQSSLHFFEKKLEHLKIINC